MYLSITWKRSEWGGKMDAGIEGRDLFGGPDNACIAKDASVSRNPEEGDKRSEL